MMKARIFLLVVFIAFFVFLCRTDISEDDIQGKYNVSVVLHTVSDSNSEEFLDAAQIQYEILENGTIKTTTTIEGRVSNEVHKWSLEGNSIVIDSEQYKIIPTSEGYLLKGDNFDLNLTML